MISFGSELELADVDVNLQLPKGNSWDYKDYTIMNSCGIGNDPKKKIVRIGSEINVKPSATVEEHVDEIMGIYEALGEQKAINHSTNFHVHVRIPGLNEDIWLLQHFATYFYENQEEIFKLTENLVKPTKEDYPENDAFKGAMKRFSRRKISHQNKISEKVYNKMIAAKTPAQFYEAHAPMGKNGKLQWQLATRGGINMMQLFNETDTIEFRHFSMSFDRHEIHSCIKWCEEIVHTIIGRQKTPQQVFEGWSYKFPEFIKYDHEKDMIFQLTNFGKLKRKEIEQNINFLIEENIVTKKQLGL